MTLIELMITLAIVVIVLSLAIATMRGYIPKQRLITSAGAIENVLQTAQTEANARSYWSCIKFFQTSSSEPITARVFVDVSGDHGTVGGACCNTNTTDPNAACLGGDIPLTKTQLKTDIQFATSGTCTYNIDKTCVIWFDTTGSPKICDNSGTCGGTPPSGGCADFNYQVIVSNPNLDTQAKSREVEALVGGLIQLVKPGDKGLVSSNPGAAWALAPGTTATGGCE